MSYHKRFKALGFPKIRQTSQMLMLSRPHERISIPKLTLPLLNLTQGEFPINIHGCVYRHVQTCIVKCFEL